MKGEGREDWSSPRCRAKLTLADKAVLETYPPGHFILAFQQGNTDKLSRSSFIQVMCPIASYYSHISKVVKAIILLHPEQHFCVIFNTLIKHFLSCTCKHIYVCTNVHKCIPLHQQQIYIQRIIQTYLQNVPFASKSHRLTLYNKCTN